MCRDWTEVPRDDAVFRAEAAAVPFDAEAEVRALRSVLEGESSGKMEAACEALGHQAKLTAMRGVWAGWRGKPTPEVAAAVRQVVTDLDAEHLRPSGIEQRLVAGVQPACLGLYTLLQSMKQQ